MRFCDDSFILKLFFYMNTQHDSLSYVEGFFNRGLRFNLFPTVTGNRSISTSKLKQKTAITYRKVLLYRIVKI